MSRNSSRLIGTRGIRLAEPIDAQQRVVAPARRVQAHQFQNRRARNLGRTAGQLISLLRRTEVLEQ